MWRGSRQMVTDDALMLDQYRRYLRNIDPESDSSCAECMYQEQQGLKTSWRQLSHQFVPNTAVQGKASYLELQIDNTCNGGCIICGPWHSSFWQRELLGKATTGNAHHVQQILASIDTAHINRILFLGGETLLTVYDQQILDAIPQPELVDLQYTTNCSVLPSRARTDRWQRFRSVQINLSLDCIKHRFDYIRYPLRWTVAERVVQSMIGELPDNVIFKINHTVNILNIWYHSDFEAWRLANCATDRQGNAIDCIFNPAVGPLAPKRIPAKLMVMLRDMYDDSSPVIRAVLDHNADVQIMLKYLGELDRRRGSDWQQSFPEIAACFA
jgi:hypothetical protein